jgi:hypothetical protein
MKGTGILGGDEVGSTRASSSLVSLAKGDDHVFEGESTGVRDDWTACSKLDCCEQVKFDGARRFRRGIGCLNPKFKLAGILMCVWRIPRPDFLGRRQGDKAGTREFSLATGAHQPRRGTG